MRLIGRFLTLSVSALLVGCEVDSVFYPAGFYPPRVIDNWEGVPRLSGIDDVLFAGQPTEEGFKLLADRGVKVIVNLRPEAEMQRTMEFDESAIVESLGMEYVHIPMTPGTFNAADVAEFEEVFYRRRTVPGEPFTMVIHCRSSNRCGGLWDIKITADFSR